MPPARSRPNAVPFAVKQRLPAATFRSASTSRTACQVRQRRQHFQTELLRRNRSEDLRNGSSGAAGTASPPTPRERRARKRRPQDFLRDALNAQRERPVRSWWTSRSANLLLPAISGSGSREIPDHLAADPEPWAASCAETFRRHHRVRPEDVQRLARVGLHEEAASRPEAAAVPRPAAPAGGDLIRPIPRAASRPGHQDEAEHGSLRFHRMTCSGAGTGGSTRLRAQIVLRASTRSSSAMSAGPASPSGRATRATSANDSIP